MQLYKGLPILTDQPAPKQRQIVPHHLVGILPVNEEYSAARFAREAAQVIGEITGRGKLPLVVGGTGLYLRALLGDFSFAGKAEATTRKKWEDFIDRQGREAALQELKRLDPRALAIVDCNNPRRLVRALEAAEAGRPLSRERNRLWSGRSKYQVFSFGLEMPRPTLYRLIDERVDRMLAKGAIDEVRCALKGEVSLTAMQAIGFKEIKDYLSGVLTLKEAASIIKQRSRRYAKRQLTWMRKMPDIVRIDLAGHSCAWAAEVIIERICSSRSYREDPE
jgi:tRNA dimethylallyltransferase